MPDILTKRLNGDADEAATPAAALTGAPWAARTLLRLLDRLSHGRLDVQWPNGLSTRHGRGAEPRASLHIHDWSVCAAVLRSLYDRLHPRSGVAP